MQQTVYFFPFYVSVMLLNFWVQNVLFSFICSRNLFQYLGWFSFHLHFIIKPHKFYVLRFVCFFNYYIFAIFTLSIYLGMKDSCCFCMMKTLFLSSPVTFMQLKNSQETHRNLLRELVSLNFLNNVIIIIIILIPR